MSENSGQPEDGAGAAENDASVPIYQEEFVGALLDSARISVHVAIELLPPSDAPLILAPGQEDIDPDIQDCLNQAMQWLDVARGLVVRKLAGKGKPPTSLHVLNGRSRG